MDSFFSKMLLAFFVLLVAASCGPSSLDDFQEEGEGVMRSLIQDLKKIHKREELIAASSKLEKRFDHLVSIMIAAEEFTFSHPEIDKRRSGAFEHDLSDRLRVELNRLYRLEGGRQIIEKCQEKSLHRLDAFEKRHANPYFSQNFERVG